MKQTSKNRIINKRKKCFEEEYFKTHKNKSLDLEKNVLEQNVKSEIILIEIIAMNYMNIIY